MENSLRPGVYLSYNVKNARARKDGVGIGIVVCGTEQKLHSVSDLSEARYDFGETLPYYFIKAIFENADCPITVAETAGNSLEAYKEAYLSLYNNRNIYFVISDNRSAEFLSFVKSELEKRNYGLFVSACSEDSEPLETAEALNCGRIVLCYPALKEKAFDLSAAVVSSMLIRESEKNQNLWLSTVGGNYELGDSMTETEKNSMLKGGVTVLESGSYGAEVIRAVTTKTKDGEGNPDSSYRNVSVPLTADRVIYSLKELLNQRLSGTGRGKTTLGSIKSLVECYFISKKDEGLISSYDKPEITLSEDDRSVCLISVGFTIFEGIAQIYMNADITI